MQANLFGGEGPAFGLHLVAWQVASELLFDRILDRQAMAIPAWDVLRVESFELALLDDHVLENLVDRMAHVDLAVGIRGPVVQYEFGRPGARIAQLLVDALFIPLPGPSGLALGQVAAHGEGCFRQIQGAAVVDFFGHEAVAASCSAGDKKGNG